MCLRRVVFAAAALLCAGLVHAQNPGKRFVIILIGPTGSGKTTQAAFLGTKFGLPIVSVDALIKENPSALTRDQEPGIDPGEPQINPAVNELVEAHLKKIDLHKGVVLDGYPATKDQADHLGGLMREFGLPQPIIIQLDVPDEVDYKRLEKRRRPDDTPEQIAQRLKDYHRELDLVRAYYPKANIWTIDGTRSIAEVSKTIESIVRDEAAKSK